MKIRSTLISTFVLASSFAAAPAWAAGPSVSAVSPATANVGTPVTFTASVSSGAGIKSCNLYVDLADEGAMTVSGNTASKEYTFAAGGSRIAFVFCKDNSGGMASGPNTSIWVNGAISNTAPLTGSNNGTTPVTPAPVTPAPVVEPIQTQSTPILETPIVPAHHLYKLACADGAAADDACKAVYYIGVDGKRHAFPNGKVFATWYENFDAVETVGQAELAQYPLGKNVTYRPGVRMVKFQTLDKVYAVSKDGVLRWVKDENLAISLYGSEWNTRIDDISDTFFMDYVFGQDIGSASDFVAADEIMRAPSID